MIPIGNQTKKRRVRSTILIHKSRHRGKKTLICGPGYFFNFAYILVHTFTQGADLNLVVANIGLGNKRFELSSSWIIIRKPAHHPPNQYWL